MDQSHPVHLVEGRLLLLPAGRHRHLHHLLVQWVQHPESPLARHLVLPVRSVRPALRILAEGHRMVEEVRQWEGKQLGHQWMRWER